MARSWQLLWLLSMFKQLKALSPSHEKVAPHWVVAYTPAFAHRLSLACCSWWFFQATVAKKQPMTKAPASMAFHRRMKNLPKALGKAEIPCRIDLMVFSTDWLAPWLDNSRSSAKRSR